MMVKSPKAIAQVTSAVRSNGQVEAKHTLVAVGARTCTFQISVALEELIWLKSIPRLQRLVNHTLYWNFLTIDRDGSGSTVAAVEEVVVMTEVLRPVIQNFHCMERCHNVQRTPATVPEMMGSVGHVLPTHMQIQSLKKTRVPMCRPETYRSPPTSIPAYLPKSFHENSRNEESLESSPLSGRDFNKDGS